MQNKHVAPESLQNKIVDYYHNELCYPGYEITLKSIAINFYWKSLQNDVSEIVKNCRTCTICKKPTGSRHEYLPLKNVEQDTHP